MMTVASTLDYNRTLTPKTMLRGVSLPGWPLHGLFHLVFIVAVTTCSESITIPQEGSNEPNEQHKRNYHGHDHIPDLIAKVHEYTNDIIRLCES